ncbi:hypothetical protein BpHYR1_006924 [Brachionus plicatilis]|uniref:G-protein coupled receptors family 1 profile domain-containing protein n=1 Tax=Brachionus plicatilis TaxID=10195 RepID=A0A3M7PXX5_BRAPC|nr:hypothetical protein BpHYR1_006924 [Brachionus plicatilis]
MNLSNLTISQNDEIFGFYVTNYLDLITRFVSFFVHILYGLIVFFNKKLHKRSYIYMHHVNFISFVYILHFMCYFFNRTVTLGDEYQLEETVCTLSEIVWRLLAFLRTYSILLLAIYRYSAVSWLNIHKKLNSKLSYLMVPIGITWLMAGLFTLVVKLSLKTTYSRSFCTPGFAKRVSLIIANQVVTAILCNLIPVGLVVYIYTKILSQLHSKTTNLNKHTKQQNSSSSQSHLKFAKQFILINIFNVLSSMVSIVVNVAMVLSSYQNFKYLDSDVEFVNVDDLFVELRPAFRAVFITLQTFVPILSIVYNPEIKCIRTFFKKSTTVSSSEVHQA